MDTLCEIIAVRDTFVDIDAKLALLSDQLGAVLLKDLHRTYFTDGSERRAAAEVRNIMENRAALNGSQIGNDHAAVIKVVLPKAGGQ